jgi:hypothetical protein
MSTKRAYRASNAAGQAYGSRASSQSCSLLIKKLNTKSLLIVGTATVRAMKISTAIRRNSVHICI